MDIYREIEESTARKYGAIAAGTKKSIGDFLLEDDVRRPVNVKSNNLDKKNYSPNIISAKRLIDWLQTEGNELFFVFVNYKVESGKIVVIDDSGLLPYFQISWDCLTIEAQGWGVIQMYKPLQIKKEQTVKEFLGGMRSAYEKYIQKETKKMAKIREMIKDF